MSERGRRGVVFALGAFLLTPSAYAQGATTPAASPEERRRNAHVRVRQQHAEWRAYLLAQHQEGNLTTDEWNEYHSLEMRLNDDGVRFFTEAERPLITGMSDTYLRLRAVAIDRAQRRRLATIRAGNVQIASMLADLYERRYLTEDEYNPYLRLVARLNDDGTRLFSDADIAVQRQLNEYSDSLIDLARVRAERGIRVR